MILECMYSRESFIVTLALGPDFDGGTWLPDGVVNLFTIAVLLQGNLGV